MYIRDQTQVQFEDVVTEFGDILVVIIVKYLVLLEGVLLLHSY